MQRMKFDESEILEAFYAKAMSDGMLDKPAEKLYADFDISAPVKSELESIVAVASHENCLYGLPGESGEEMVGKAHPGGGTTIDLDNNKPKDKDLAKVETIVERQKVMREVAEGKPTGKLAQAMVKLVSLANMLDERGEVAAAAEIDAEIAKLAADLGPGDEYAPGITMGKPTVTTAPPSEQPDAELNAARQAWQGSKAKADKAALLKANNSRIINRLNQIRAAEGRAPLAASEQAGVITKEVAEELRNTVGSDYKTWRELFEKLEQRVPAAAPGHDVSRRGVESGAPASIPNLEVAVPPVALPQKGLPVAPRK